MQVAESSISVLDDTFVCVQLVRLELLRGDLVKGQHWIRRYEIDKDISGMYYHLYEMTQLVLLRAAVLGLESDPAPALSLCERLTILIQGAERRERVTPVIEAPVSPPVVANAKSVVSSWASTCRSSSAESSLISRFFARELAFTQFEPSQ